MITAYIRYFLANLSISLIKSNLIRQIYCMYIIMGKLINYKRKASVRAILCSSYKHCYEEINTLVMYLSFLFNYL